ncbi:MAG: hypothetical protein IPN46_20085 [Saprospiraceae bacterium]|nr:hypothetical protein [Saprospiraceae bacterium]
MYIFLNQDGVFALSISDRIHQLFNAVMDDDVTAGNTLSSSQIYFEDMNGDNATDIVFIKHSTGLLELHMLNLHLIDLIFQYCK